VAARAAAAVAATRTERKAIGIDQIGDTSTGHGTWRELRTILQRHVQPESRRPAAIGGGVLRRNTWRHNELLEDNGYHYTEIGGSDFTATEIKTRASHLSSGLVIYFLANHFSHNRFVARGENLNCHFATISLTTLDRGADASQCARFRHVRSSSLAARG